MPAPFHAPARADRAPVRERVLTRLTASNASVTWINQIRTVVALDRADERRAFGESLPAGLRLMAEESNCRVSDSSAELASK